MPVSETTQICVYITLGLLILMVELGRPRPFPYDILTLFNLSYFLYFVVAPLHLILGGSAYTRQDWIFHAHGAGSISIALWIFVSYILVILGYIVTPHVQSLNKTGTLDPLVWRIAAAVSFSLGVLGFVAYAAVVGSVSAAILKASFIRQGTVEVSGGLFFMKHFISMLISGTFFLFVVAHERRQKAHLDFSFALKWIAVFFVVVVFVGLVEQGRRVVLFPIVVLFLLLSNYYTRWNGRALLALFPVSIGVMVFWDVFGWILGGEVHLDRLYDRVATLGYAYQMAFRPMADAYIHWVKMIHYDGELWAFQDFLSWPLHLVPGSLVGPVSVPTVLEHTTWFIRGMSNQDIAGEPPAFHGYFYMSGGVPGLLIGSAAYGTVLRILHGLTRPSPSTLGSHLVYLWIAIGAVYFVRHGMFLSIILERFHWWVGLALVLIVGLMIRTGRSAAQTPNRGHLEKSRDPA
ncbi:hypothetical protein CKO28_23565 [Rhodovibrio sodomensis]|uniref:Oligosaccharide repeat unit polymerase n=1 Tax=Rhodovibrio sodomensis TaxID=1088 RepID=A0ABS1DKF0_9PROT|nr:hypothetical protein [Rhodovibrio sodomensis]MBK1670990.1 hypothetical protein [Rhodovibrio sodomensis]